MWRLGIRLNLSRETRSSVLLSLGLLALFLTGCSLTPEPTEVAPTQTPWIVVITATPGEARVAEALPTQTPWIVVVTATPAQARRATATPTKSDTVTGTGPTAEPSPTESPQAGSPPAPSPTTRPTATSTPAQEEIKYRAPKLLDPPPENRVSWRSRVLLKWASVGELGQDEYYRLEFDRPPTTEGMEPYGDYVFVKDNEYLWERAALAPFHPPEVQGDAQVYWWVRVVRKTGEDENGKPVGIDISPPSDKGVLIVEPKPEGQ